MLHSRVFVVYPCDHMAYWELWLTATAPRDRVSYHKALAREKIKIQIKFLVVVYHLSTIVKLEIVS